ncbi:xanthine and CO dehydrogenases maturation factor, XdhC/CoxF family [Longilinea arvoryzae]|uniref:Xanthine and CO dehydrogenases maturation factor, XdhC/CoxF family n=1 Tax=Longilinea arvoryzae TaxID=360412 RepID=A0A0S7B8I5_9CHLR|nr:XdhC/CoxI family protein [Longilinea arvoryzae]GAP13655.1 xanthine and CO dehydrogenases maturation factor, XdhC/CoxF family [Longilinea arvoryzae]
MREVITEVETWDRAGKKVAIATNVKRRGMSLRPLAAKMAMTTGMEIAGSVTGGCLEGAVYEEAQGVIETLQPKLLHYGVTGNESPWDVGLACGNSLDVFVESFDSPAWRTIFPAMKFCLEENQLAVVATVISGPGLGNKLMLWPDGRTLGDLGNPSLNAEAQVWMRDLIRSQEADWKEFAAVGEKVDVFADVLVPEARMIVIGASHIAIPLVELAKVLGYRTIVIDPREAFATRERFPHVDDLIVEWPSTALEKLHLDEASYVVAVSHDDKLDNPALAVALTHPTRYVGVLGTRKNISKRHAALQELGVTQEQLDHLRAPIGLRLNALLPEEIALSILSEMVMVRHEFSQC